MQSILCWSSNWLVNLKEANVDKDKNLSKENYKIANKIFPLFPKLPRGLWNEYDIVSPYIPTQTPEED